MHNNAKQIAERTVETWDKYDRFRVIPEEGLDEPSGVTVARAYLKALKEIADLQEQVIAAMGKL